MCSIHAEPGRIGKIDSNYIAYVGPTSSHRLRNYFPGRNYDNSGSSIRASYSN